MWISSPGMARQRSGDCACFLTKDLFSHVLKRHFNFEDVHSFRTENATLAQTVGDQAFEACVRELVTESSRRRAVHVLSAERKARIASEYVPKHPELRSWTPKWLHQRCLLAVAQARESPAVARVAWTAGMGEVERVGTQRIYRLPVLTPEACAKLRTEFASLRTSGLETSRPNSMNRFGHLLVEVGLEGFADGLLRDCLNPLAAILFPETGGGTLDSYKAFTVLYSVDGDDSLSEHVDNAEVTLNVSLGGDFDGGELAFAGAGSSQTFVEHEQGIGIIHVGRQAHKALPLTRGVRENLIIWGRSLSWRAQNGCPMCGEEFKPLIR